MKRYYKAGYYLIKQKPIKFGENIGKIVGTCSGCINFSVFDNWCLSWMPNKLDTEEKSELNLTDAKIKDIHEWTEQRFNNDSNIFPDFKTAKEFKELFLDNRIDIGIYSINFSEIDADFLIEQFAEGQNVKDFNYNNGNFSLKQNLIKKEKENNSGNEELLGYDFIGVECDGSFHSFYCHNLAATLIDRFHLKLNSNGLFENPETPEEIRAYLNDPKTGLEPVPWYIVKVKRVRNDGH